MNPILRAAAFAQQAHQGQMRKDGQPYITHPARVATAAILHGMDETAVCAAWLHDVIEDCDVAHQVVFDFFGDAVRNLVVELTNEPYPKSIPRPERKKMDRERIARASREAKQLKLLDRIDNIGDMVGYSLKFLRIYLEESELLLQAIADADEVLAQRLQSIIDRQRVVLEIEEIIFDSTKA